MVKYKTSDSVCFIGYALLLAICSSVLYLSGFGNDKFVFFRATAIVTITELVVFIYINCKRGNLISFQTLFAAFLFVFNFGQVIILAFFSNIYERIIEYNVIELVTFTQYRHALQLINLSFSLICLGMLFPHKEKIVKDNAFDENEVQIRMHKFAIYILILTFPLKIIIDVWQLYIAATSGAVAAREALSSVPDAIVTFGNLSIIGFVLLLWAEKNKVKRLKLLSFELLYFCLTMLSGRRSETAVTLCVIFIFYLIITIKKVKVKSVVVIFALGYLFATILYTIVYMRVNHGNSMSIGVFFSSFLHCLTNENILLEVLREYGNTGYTAIMVIENWLPKFGPVMGKSYYLGIFPVFINIGGIAGDLTTQSRFTLQLVESEVLDHRYTNIGGSLIGELFFNFGIVGGVLASFICGLIIGKIFRKTMDYFRTADFVKLSVCIIPIIAIIYSVRSEFYYMIRDVVWGYIFSILLANILFKKTKVSPKEG